MATAFIGLGSNVGDREGTLKRAVERLRSVPETTVTAVSKWTETDPVGGPPQGTYFNGVVQIQTSLKPKTLLSYFQEIEQAFGRPESHVHWGPRVIDLDLLTYDDLVLEEPDLVLPHPRLHERPFVLIPLAQIAPTWRHPKLGKSAKELLEDHPALI